MSPYEKATEKLLNCLTTAVSSFSYCIVLFISCKPAPAWSLMIPVHLEDSFHGLINYKDTKVKCRHLKQFTCKLTCVYQSLFTWDTVSHVDIFDPALWNVAPLPFSLVQLSPLPCVIKHTVYTYTVCKGGIWGSRPQTDKLPLQVIFFHILHWLLWVLPFYDSFKAGLRTGCARFINCLSWLWLKTLLCTDIASVRSWSCRKKDYRES
jgi:hypothetical protein